MAFSIKQVSAKAARYLVIGGGIGLSGATAYRYNGVLQREHRLPSQPLEVFATTKSATDDEKNNKSKRIIIIGGGVVGITTAYKLANKGHSVVVLEPRQAAAAECSACAAGGMQRSNPVVDRNTWIAVLKCVVPNAANLMFGGDKEGPYKFFHIAWGSTLSDPFFLRWLITFARTSLFPDQHQEERQLEMLKFTKYAVDDMVDSLMENRHDSMGKQSGYNSQGSLSLSYTPYCLIDAPMEAKPSNGNATSSKMNFEPSRNIIDVDEILQLEPSLRWQVRPPTSAKFEYNAKSASSERFTKELAERCANDPKLDVTILYETGVKAISVEQPTKSAPNEKPRISMLKTNRGIITVPDDVKVVVAAGSWTPHILARMDLYAPVYPLKGYAMSVSAKEALRRRNALKPEDLPSRIVSDKYMYTTRLGDDEIRITSIGEFSGWSTSPTPQVDVEFRQEATRQFPQLQQLIEEAITRCGHRPYINDGILLLGAIDTHKNLYVSCGPGSNGWKLAMGSGEIIGRLVEDQTEAQISQDLGFDVGTFSPSGRVLKAPLFSKLCRVRWNV